MNMNEEGTGRIEPGSPPQPEPRSRSAVPEEFRPPRPEEFAAFAHLEARGFLHGAPSLATGDALPGPAGPDSRPADAMGSPPYESPRGIFAGGVPVAGLYLHHFRTLWVDREIPMEGVGGVVALPEARRRGYTERALAGSLADMRAREVPLSFITTPFSYRFYQKMGWGYAFRRSEFTFPTLDALPLGQHARGEAHFVQSSSASLRSGGLPDSMDGIYLQALRSRYHGLALRDGVLWEKHLRGEKTYAYVWEGPNGPSGYVILRSNGPELRATELVFVDRNALLGLLGLLGHFDSQARTVRVELPCDVRLDALLPEPGEVGIGLKQRGMLRIVDIPRAMAARSWDTVDTRLAVHLEVEDALAPWNRGGWDVCLMDGEARVEPNLGKTALATARLDISVLSSLYGGDLTAEDACHLGLIQADGGAAKALTRLFSAPTRPLHLEWY